MEKVGKLLFVYPHQMFPVAGGGVVRSLQILRFLLDEGWRLELLTVRVSRNRLLDLIGRECKITFIDEVEHECSITTKEKKMRERLPELRDKSIYYRNYCSNVIDAGRSLMQSKQYSHLLTNYLWTTDLFKGVPENIVKIIDTHDLQFMRARQFKSSGERVEGYDCNKGFEIRKYKLADKIICINREELYILSKYFETSKLIYLPFVPERKDYNRVKLENNVIFVGNKYMPNELGIKRFIEESWIRVISDCPSARLVIVGKVGESLEEYKERADIEITGRVETLEPYYARASVAIVPVVLGTGLKIKAIEALSYCKPVIISKDSSDGIEYFDKYSDQCARDYQEFGEKVSAILRNTGIRRNLESRVRKYLKDGVSSSSHYRDFLSTI